MYIAKAWFTTIIIASVILSITEGFVNLSAWESFYTSLVLVFVMIVCSMAFSVPTIIAQFLLLTYLKHSESSKHTIKISLSVLSVFGVFLSFYILDSHSFSLKNNFLFWPITYAGIMVAAIWYYKLDDTEANINISNEQQHTH